jgi:hypothetical protein
MTGMPVRPEDRFPVDNAGTRAQRSHCLRDQGKPFRQIIAWTAVEPHPLAILARNDFVHPNVTARRLRGVHWKEGRNETGEGMRREHDFPENTAAFA